MADTKGLLATRKMYMDAVEAGETDLDHKAWYEQMIKAQMAEKDLSDQKAGFDSVANNKQG